MGVNLETAIVAAVATIVTGLITGVPGMWIAMSQIKKEKMLPVYTLLEALQLERDHAVETSEMYRLEVIRLTNLLIARENERPSK